MRRAHLLAVTLLALAACEDRRTGVVSPLKQYCPQLDPNVCIEVIEDDGTVLDVHAIEDYVFQWGRRQRIEFLYDDIKDGPDAPSYRLDYQRTLGTSRLAPGTRFELFLPDPPSSGTLFPDVDGILALSDGTPVACDGLLRDQLIAEHGKPVMVTLELTGNEVPLRCVSWRYLFKLQ